MSAQLVQKKSNEFIRSEPTSHKHFIQPWSPNDPSNVQPGTHAYARRPLTGYVAMLRSGDDLARPLSERRETAHRGLAGDHVETMVRTLLYCTGTSYTLYILFYLSVFENRGSIRFLIPLQHNIK